MPQINFMNELGIAMVVLVIAMMTSVRILREYERAVVFRLGRLTSARGPGLVLLIPFWIERMQRVSLRTVVQDVTPQDVITKDNVSVSVNAVLTFRIVDAAKAVVEVEDFGFAISQLAQTTLRSVLGSAELDDLLSEREKLNQELEEIIQRNSESWGISVIAMEIKACRPARGNATRDGETGRSRAGTPCEVYPRYGRIGIVRSLDGSCKQL